MIMKGDLQEIVNACNIIRRETELRGTKGVKNISLITTFRLQYINALNILL